MNVFLNDSRSDLLSTKYEKFCKPTGFGPVEIATPVARSTFVEIFLSTEPESINQRVELEDEIDDKERRNKYVAIFTIAYTFDTRRTTTHKFIHTPSWK